MINSESSPRIGVFGGTFDPPHNGHLALARAARQQLHLDQMLWVLTPDPPHKQGDSLTPTNHRLEMLNRGIANMPGMTISRVELDRPGPHYAVDTVRMIKDTEAHGVLIYIMGGDSLVNLPTWHKPKEFVYAVDYIGVLRRADVVIDLASIEAILPGIKNKILFVEIPTIHISSSEIRERIASGKPFEHLVPRAIASYIHEQCLYDISPRYSTERNL